MYFSECGGILTTPSGIITSPGYPGVFPLNLDCGWKIVQPEGTRINMTFSNFILSKPNEQHGDYRDCKNYIKMFDAPYPDDNLRRFK